MTQTNKSLQPITIPNRDPSVSSRSGGFARVMSGGHQVMLKKAFKVVLVFAALVCTAASCGTQRSASTLQPVTRSGPHCAFADPECTTSMGICYLAAEYYAAHREWPLTKAGLNEQLTKMLEAERANMSAEEMQDSSEFFNRFTMLDLRKSGEDLVMHYRFKIERKTVDQTVTLRPNQTADEILQSATAKGYD